MGVQSPSPKSLSLLLTDASKTDWGAHLQDLTSADVWTRRKSFFIPWR